MARRADRGAGAGARRTARRVIASITSAGTASAIRAAFAAPRSARRAPPWRRVRRDDARPAVPRRDDARGGTRRDRRRGPAAFDPTWSRRFSRSSFPSNRSSRSGEVSRRRAASEARRGGPRSSSIRRCSSRRSFEISARGARGAPWPRPRETSRCGRAASASSSRCRVPRPRAARAARRPRARSDRPCHEYRPSTCGRSSGPSTDQTTRRSSRGRLRPTTSLEEDELLSRQITPTPTRTDVAAEAPGHAARRGRPHRREPARRGAARRNPDRRAPRRGGRAPGLGNRGRRRAAARRAVGAQLRRSRFDLVRRECALTPLARGRAAPRGPADPARRRPRDGRRRRADRAAARRASAAHRRRHRRRGRAEDGARRRDPQPAADEPRALRRGVARAGRADAWTSRRGRARSGRASSYRRWRAAAASRAAGAPSRRSRPLRSARFLLRAAARTCPTSRRGRATSPTSSPARPVATREYERRIDELEAELAKSRAATAEAKTQLAAVLQLVDVLKPSV